MFRTIGRLLLTHHPHTYYYHIIYSCLYFYSLKGITL
nr:MAG TPA: hypothetical protein [Caudoviricetes sp.]